MIKVGEKPSLTEVLDSPAKLRAAIISLIEREDALMRKRDSLSTEGFRVIAARREELGILLQMAYQEGERTLMEATQRFQKLVERRHSDEG